ncbi:MAG: hypothetical protein K2X47_13790, partial [Bdellovibrionales bacterium]|nr:hypothetical protein [Bdellovibrionales bacterium]
TVFRWKEMTAVDLIDRDSGSASPLHQNRSQRTYLRIQRQLKRRISTESISDGLSNQELMKVALAIRRWRKTYANTMKRP